VVAGTAGFCGARCFADRARRSGPRGTKFKDSEWLLRVNLRHPIFFRRTAGIGATLPLPRASAKDRFATLN
jgi:hypothetical protein